MKPLPVIHAVYKSAGDAAQAAATMHKFPCASGCSHCCTIPIFATDADMAMVMDGLTTLAPEQQIDVARRSTEYAATFEKLADTVATAEEVPDGLGGDAMDVPTFLASVWPDGGIPCPLLEHDGDTGAGKCSIYAHRPLTCRLHYAMGPERCRPTQPPHDVAKLDSAKVLGRAATAAGAGPKPTVLGLALAAILGDGPRIVTPNAPTARGRN